MELMRNNYPRDAYGDPRDYALEARQILNGELVLSPTQEHCLALLVDILNRRSSSCGWQYDETARRR